MKNMVNLTIDGVKVEVPEGTLIVDAARRIGIGIPVFCYHPKMEPVGMCRMCLVEVGRPMRDRATGEPVLEEDGSPKIQYGPKLETACTTPVSEGMVVVGNSDKVIAGRDDILEFLLTSHPLDCPICDKGGECALQDLTIAHGPGLSRFIYDEKFQFRKHVPLGELIVLDRERCIQCARCTRFQDEVVGDPVIGFFQRGRALEIVTFSEPGFDSYFSGNTTDICPVGALTTTDFRFEARPWELMSAASICPHCPVGCNTTLNTRREARAGGQVVVKRVMPRQNEQVNEIWICDKGRFEYHFAQHGDRLKRPLVRKDGELVEVDWPEALEAAAAGLRQAGTDVLALGGGRLSNEDLYSLRELAEGLGGKAAHYTNLGGGDLTAQVGVGQGTNLSDLGPGSAILVVASNLEEEAPIWYLRVKQAAERGATLIVANPRPTKLDKHAAHVLRYPYGDEAATVLAMVNSLSAKRPEVIQAPGGPLPRDASAVAQAAAAADNLIVIYGQEGVGLEASQALAQACTNLLMTTNHTGRANNGLLAAWPVGNSQGAWDMGLQPLPNLPEALGQAKALYIAAADPVGDQPQLAGAVRAADFVIVQELFLTETAQLADVVFPVQSFVEREGTFTSGERRVQRFYPGLPPRPYCLPDYAILAQAGKLLGLDMEERTPLLIFEKRIAAKIPGYAGLTYTQLAEVTSQWPIMGRDDLYYGGTTYENRQGLGVQLSPAAQRGEQVSLSWTPPQQAQLPEGGLLAVPVTRLYDRGWLAKYSQLLDVRTAKPHVALSPADAARLSVQAGDTISLDLADGAQAPVAAWIGGVTARIDENVPAGIVLVPRSLSFAISSPVLVQVRATRPVTA